MPQKAEGERAGKRLREGEKERERQIKRERGRERETFWEITTTAEFPSVGGCNSEGDSISLQLVLRRLLQQ